MTLQRGYAAQLLKYVSKSRKEISAVITSLKQDPSKLDQDAWESLHRLNRRPKPSYLSGLTPVAERFVESRAAILNIPMLARKPLPKSNEPIRLTNMAVRATARISQTSEARRLQDAFGFVGGNLSTLLFQNLTIDFYPGQITLICGASGAGKSLFMSAIEQLVRARGRTKNRRRTDALHVDFEGTCNRVARVSTLTALPENKVALEVKGRISLERFLTVCAKCGLAEPQLFARPIASLSSGQKYRLQIALSFLENPEILLVDNFCEAVDKYTMLAVCAGALRLANEIGATVVVATAAYDRLLTLFKPHQLVLLRRGDEPLITRSGEQNAHL